MKEFIEKLIGRLEEEKRLVPYNRLLDTIEDKPKEVGQLMTYQRVIEIVNQLAEEYNGGWIPCSERLPETNDAVNITWVNRKPEPYYKDIKDKPFTATGHYHKGKWYWYSCVCKDYLDEYGNSDIDEVDKDIEIIAWQPLPAPYQSKGE